MYVCVWSNCKMWKMENASQNNQVSKLSNLTGQWLEFEPCLFLTADTGSSQNLTLTDRGEIISKFKTDHVCIFLAGAGPFRGLRKLYTCALMWSKYKLVKKCEHERWYCPHCEWRQSGCCTFEERRRPELHRHVWDLTGQLHGRNHHVVTFLGKIRGSDK